ncbi:MAG: nitrate reductase [Burkholderiales bacterium]|nr:nitrate reductase [Burkholderiales bacterium]
MSLLEFARGPALAFALTVFVVGTLWRLIGILRLPRHADLSPARAGAPSPLVAALRANLRAMWPRPEFRARTLHVVLNGYAFHVGLALVVFGYAPHIAFVERLTGLAWPALPDPVMYVAAALTIVSLLLALAMRLNDPVRRRIASADDHISWALTMLPMFTGMAVATEPSAALLARDHVVFGTPLAVHLLSVELLLIWFPFGKLMHGVLFAFSRGATGVRFSHRGVRP